MKYFSSISPHPSVNKDITIYTLENTEGVLGGEQPLISLLTT